MTAKLTMNSPVIILRVAIAVPLPRLFDYLAPDAIGINDLRPGIRLKVPFGSQTKIAYLVEVDTKSDQPLEKLKAILAILDPVPLLSGQDLQLLQWASRYYHHPLGEVISAAFPAALRKVSDTPETKVRSYRLTEVGEATPIEALKRSPQQQALLALFQSDGRNHLTETELNQWHKNWRSVIKSLLAKALLEYYDLPLAESPKKTSEPVAAIQCSARTEVHLNPAQQDAVIGVQSCLGSFAAFLLEGVTGSGKTEVYMQIIRTVLERGQQVLVLVPEINLTPQLQARFQQRFPGVIALTHSNLTNKQRHAAWVTMQKGDHAILLGTRSALFTPMQNLGLILLDEEHDTSFKQQEGFRFSARDVAVMRAKIQRVPVVLGSATPSLESLFNVSQKRYQHLILNERAGNAAEPKLHLLDIRNKKLQSGLSESLLTEINKTLERQEQALLFLNRRGFAPTLICHGCGWVARCQSCDANLVIHHNEQRLRCHHCGKEQRLPPVCPSCTTGELTSLGLGTERVEQTLLQLFPQKRLIRLDRDTTQRKGRLEHYLDQINQGEADIILGTQMLAKGHHFPLVTLVAILDVDSGLFGIDYRSSERLAQLIVQVSGRAGRENKPGKVILQTRCPEHPMLHTVINQGYRHFAEIALAERKGAGLPPYSYHALLRVQAHQPHIVQDFLRRVIALVKPESSTGSQILGPVAAPMEKRAGMHRYQLLVQTSKRHNMQQILDNLLTKINSLKDAKKVRWSLDVDPVDLF
jgi:primosomal protein N' (replication factor Y) (superfamily II helicase)